MKLLTLTSFALGAFVLTSAGDAEAAHTHCMKNLHTGAKTHGVTPGERVYTDRHADYSNGHDGQIHAHIVLEDGKQYHLFTMD